MLMLTTSTHRIREIFFPAVPAASRLFGAFLFLRSLSASSFPTRAAAAAGERRTPPSPRPSAVPSITCVAGSTLLVPAVFLLFPPPRPPGFVCGCSHWERCALSFPQEQHGWPLRSPHKRLGRGRENGSSNINQSIGANIKSQSFS